MRAFIEQFRQRLFFRATHVDRLAIYNLRDVRRLVIHVADQDRLRRADDDTGGLKPNVDAMRAEVAFLGRVIFGIDEDRIVRASGHAGFAADADRFIEIDNAVSAFEHRGSRAGSDARRVRALVAASDLVRAPHLRKDTDVNVLDVGPRDADGNDVFRLAGGRARMT